MNQQRSRRFRSAQEAQEKEEAHKEAVAMWEGQSSRLLNLPLLSSSRKSSAMGKTISDEEKNKKSWDSNAITPGTPFMTLLAQSLRYWVAQKLNTDPGWKQVRVLPSPRIRNICADIHPSSRLSYPTQAYQEKENTRLWISFAGNVLMLGMTPTRVMSSTDL